jgi:hypothetical protein
MPNIRLIIAYAVRGVLAVSIAGAATAQDPAPQDPAPQHPDAAPATCAFDPARFHMAQTPDYVVKVHLERSCMMGPGKKEKINRRDEVLFGAAPCAVGSAAERATCKAAYKGLKLPPPYCRGGTASGSSEVLVMTAGADVVLLNEINAVKALLGPIDTPSEALFALKMVGYGCLAAPTVTKSGVYETQASRMTNDCPMTHDTLSVTIDAAGEVKEVVINTTNAGGCAGRRPEGLVTLDAGRAASEGACVEDQDQDEVGLLFGQLAQLERVAVNAFEVIAAELEALGAPADLIARAQEAARDEEEHTLLMRALALKYGVTPGEPVVEDRPLRGLWAFALDNATEGCVRETFGVAFARYQEATAQDPEVAAVAAQVAEDEGRHAQLSWDIGAWCEGQLDATQRAMLKQAQREAVESLRADAANGRYSARLGSVAGVPTPQAALRLVEALDQALWSPPDEVD